MEIESKFITKYTKIYNSKGYKLYFYDKYSFKLVEITEIEKFRSYGSEKLPSGDEWSIWGEQVLVLNDEEYKKSTKIISKSKELYDKYKKQMELVQEIPLSKIINLK
jgi:hypothetical protein